MDYTGREGHVELALFLGGIEARRLAATHLNTQQVENTPQVENLTTFGLFRQSNGH